MTRSLGSLMDLRTSSVSSVEALSETITSILAYVCVKAPSTQPFTSAALLYVGIPMVISG